MNSALLTAAFATPLAAEPEENALLRYVRKPDAAFAWKVDSMSKDKRFSVVRLTMISQEWRGGNWKHDMVVVRPTIVRHPDIAFIYITGSVDLDSQLKVLKRLAEQSGAITASIGDVPNQPLYDGLMEDALIAYTFDKYARTGDDTWPLLFPMVKSAVRGIQAVQEVARKEMGQEVKRAVLAGASKRGWTTWLTAAVDSRVAGIAPIVFDMLNMKAQTAWAQRVYGRQSESIQDYSDANLIARMDEPPIAKLREWIDPFSYRNRYTMPKLILLGTNDPYWTVDSLRHYWNDLPDPKLIHQTPNAGHAIVGGKEAVNALAAFFELVAAGEPLPKVQWSIRPDGDFTSVNVHVDRSARAARLWTASSPDRDFRNDQWKSETLTVKKGSARIDTRVAAPTRGYRAFLVETELTTPSGKFYNVSTEARVTPDFD